MRKMYSKKQIESMVNSQIDSQKDHFSEEVLDVVNDVIESVAEESTSLYELVNQVDENSEKLEEQKYYEIIHEFDENSYNFPITDTTLQSKLYNRGCLFQIIDNSSDEVVCQGSTPNTLLSYIYATSELSDFEKVTFSSLESGKINQVSVTSAQFLAEVEYKLSIWLC